MEAKPRLPVLKAVFEMHSNFTIISTVVYVDKTTDHNACPKSSKYNIEMHTFNTKTQTASWYKKYWTQ